MRILSRRVREGWAAARQARAQRAARGPWGDERSVADTVGSILMVGITVVMSVVLGTVLMAFKGPVPLAHSDLAVTVQPGADGTWGDGNEYIQVVHRGGDALAASSVSLKITVAGTTRTLSGAAQLGSAWGDGKLTIGEVWTYVWPGGIQQGQSVATNVVNSAAQSQLLSGSVLVAAAVANANPCVGHDNAFPTVQLWAQTPSILTGFTSGGVTIQAQLGDDCFGPNPSVVPTLYWRITPTATFTQVTMSSVGTNTWQASIPSQSWNTLVGQSLIYHIAPLTDLGGNAGTSPDQTSVVQTDCSTDNAPPSIATLAQSPADVRSSTSGAVTVSMTVTDNCAGADQNTNPHLLYRFNDGSNPSFTDGGAMTRTGTNAWQGTIPSQTWALLAGRTLEYQVQGMRDLNGNLGSSIVYQDVIDALYTYTYANSQTPTQGTVTAPSSCCSAGAGTDSGAEATFAEAANSATPVTVTFNANGVNAANGWTSATNVFASDNAYATYATSTPLTPTNDLKVDLQDPSVTTGTICSTLNCGGVVLHAEVSITGYSNDGFSIYACLSGGLCNALSAVGGQSATDINVNYDISGLRPGGGTWTWTDITNLQGVVSLVQGGSRDGTWRVDRVWVDVTSTTQTYALSIAAGFPAVPSGASQTLDIKYRATGDTFNVQVCQDAITPCATWTTRGATLNAASSTTWTYVLTTLEYNAGSPRIRFTDVSPTGTTQGNLFLDYVRVDTL